MHWTADRRVLRDGMVAVDELITGTVAVDKLITSAHDEDQSPVV
jgi:hypothetical protein